VQTFLDLEGMGRPRLAERPDEKPDREVRLGVGRAQRHRDVADELGEDRRLEGHEDAEVAARIVELAAVERVARVEDHVVGRRQDAGRAALVDVDARLRKDEVRPRSDVVVDLVPERVDGRAAKLADLEALALEQQARGRGCGHPAPSCTS